jgi:sugar lactone lactonase YvrE
MKFNKVFPLVLAAALAAVFSFQRCQVLWTPEFVEVPCPEIDSFSPSGAPYDSVVTVKGRNFCAGAPEFHLVRIGATEVPTANISVPDDQTLLITVPKGIGCGRISVEVKTADGCVAESAETFLYKFTVASVALFAGTADDPTCATCFSSPRGMGVDGNGNVYVADRNHNVIKKVTVEGVTTTYAGNGEAMFRDDPVGLFAKFNGPMDVAVDAQGHLYVTDETNNRIRKIDAGTSHAVSTFSGETSGDTDNTNLLDARYSRPTGIAVSPDQKIFVTEFSKNRLRMLDYSTNSGFVTTLINTGLSNPVGVFFSNARDAMHPIIVSDRGNGAVRTVGADKSVASIPIAFTAPNDVASDDCGSLYVTEQSGGRIYAVYPDNSSQAIAGTGINFQFKRPSGITFDKQRNFLYVSDEQLHVIVKIVLE